MALWDKVDSSGDVQDRRGQRSSVAFGGGIAGLLIVAAFVALTGGSTSDVLDAVLNQAGQQTSQQPSDQPFEDPTNYELFASKTLGSANESWTNLLAGTGTTYTAPTLVLFRNATQSGCGTATSSVGPHYCPIDQTIYIDETFFDAIRSGLGASTGGEDVAQAYVIAHEVGHHVQHLLGTMDRVDPTNPDDSVRLELQADCYAGLWASYVREQGIFENDNEINEAIGLASAIGDDRIQEKTDGQVNPETWTHGSSDQRVRWFTVGYESGDLDQCQEL